ncbi:N-acetyl-D-glucosamine kinase [compost metagenome]
MNIRNTVIGADIGGSHITAALIDMDNKCLVPDSKVRHYVDSKGSVEAILQAWKRAIEEVLTVDGASDVKRVTFAMPGPFDYENGISLIKGLDKYESIYGLDIKQFFMEVLQTSSENVIFRNDAEAFLHGEMFCGAGVDFEKAIGLTLGTGFGSAISHKGITTDIEFGAKSFKESIADDYFSTRWFVKRYNELTGIQVKDVKDMMDSIAKNKVGTEIFAEYANNLSLFLERAIKEYPVAHIILGGNISLIHNYFLNKVKENLLKVNLDITFVIAELKEDAAIMGAAASFETLSVLGQ